MIGDKQIKLIKITKYDKEINKNWRKRRERNGLDWTGIERNEKEQNEKE